MANGLIPQETIDEIANRLDIVEIIRQYVPLKKQGSNYQGLCPFHHEKTPSFSVSPERQMFYCFGCGVGGNVFTFLMQQESLTFPEAVEKLASQVGVSIVRAETNPQRQRFLQKKDRLYRINQEAAAFFHRNLFSRGAHKIGVLTYLQKRSLDEDIIKQFQLGWASSAWDGLINYLTNKGAKAQELVELGLALPNKNGTGYYDRFRNRIIFPIWDNVGRVIAFGGRVLDESLPKYLNSPDTILFNKSENLYGLHLAKKAIRDLDLALIVEGYLDVIVCHQHGIVNAVASLGTAFTTEQAKLLMRYSYQQAIAYDADMAGAKATLRSLDILNELGSEVRVVNLPSGQDPDDFLRNNGPEEFNKLINQSESLIEYKLNEALKNIDLSSIIGKTKVVQAIAPDLLAIKSPLARSEVIEFVSHQIGLTQANILEELKKFNHRANLGKNVEDDPGSAQFLRKKNIDQNQLQLIRIVFEDNNLISWVDEAGGDELFTSPVKELYRQIRTAFRDQGKVEVADFDMKSSRILAAVLLEEFPFLKKEQAAADYIKVLQLNRLNREYAAKEKELQEAEKNKDLDKQISLLTEIENILQQKRLLTP